MAALEVAIEGGTTLYGQQPGQERFGRGGREDRAGLQRSQLGGQGMGIMDTDQDGQISADEWQGEPETFDRFDANDDGYLTRNEIQRGSFSGRGRGRNPQALFESMDTNSDERISPEEFRGPAPMFALLDANGDGVLASEELTTARGFRGARGLGGGGPAARFENLDADGDGQISSDEWAGPDQTFRMLDADGDGLLSSDEMLAGRGARGQQP